MKFIIKQYEYEKKEIDSKEIELPTETCYFFETGIRRSIKIVPKFTSWNKKTYNKEEELYELRITCLYQSSECKIEKFSIRAKDLETIYYAEKHEHKNFVTSLINGWFDVRNEEQFNEDFKSLLAELNKES